MCHLPVLAPVPLLFTCTISLYMQRYQLCITVPFHCTCNRTNYSMCTCTISLYLHPCPCTLSLYLHPYHLRVYVPLTCPCTRTNDMYLYLHTAVVESTEYRPVICPGEWKVTNVKTLKGLWHGIVGKCVICIL